MNELEEGIAALRSGDRATARKLIVSELRLDKNNLRAWQWMYNASDNDTERRKCLEHILHIDPGNQKATQILLKLQGTYPAAIGTDMTDDEFVDKMRGWLDKSQEWPEMDKQAAIGEAYKKETENFETLTEKTKKCPYCAETILEKADICKHCGKNINSTQILGQQLGTISKSMQSVGCLLMIFVSIPACLCIGFLLMSGQ